jgi:5-oxoprolinase (ATP-hydrolysing)
VSVEAIGGGDAVAEQPPQRAPRNGALAAAGSVRMFSEGEWHVTPLYARDDTRVGDTIDGPAIIAEANATTVVEPGWQARVTEQDHLVLSEREPRRERRAIGTDVDPVMLEVFNNLFMSIAEQMGLRLQATAYSVNIKERLDFSCALFDADGNLIANAPHMPVHLGSMSESIKTVMRENAGKMRAGDAYVVNDPYHGGTHLPDVTVITPVFDRAGEAILFYVGSRGHHADIGGTTPGIDAAVFSHARRGRRALHQLPADRRAGRGPPRAAARSRADADPDSAEPHPARNPAQNLADLRAQIAANEKGREELLKMVDAVRAGRRAGLHGARAGQRRGVGAARHHALKDGAFDYRLDNGA